MLKFITLLFLISLNLLAQQDLNTLWNKQAATKWVDGFPIGNGRLGMIIQGHLNEEFVINEDSLWVAPENRTIEGSHTQLAELKKLIAQEKYTAAESLVEQKMIKTKHQSLNNRPLCKVNLSFHENEQSDNYKRSLNMQTGISSLKYLKNGISQIIIIIKVR